MLIDPAIWWKVLMPLTVFVVIFSLTRGYLFRLLMAKSETLPKAELQLKCVVMK